MIIYIFQKTVKNIILVYLLVFLYFMLHGQYNLSSIGELRKFQLKGRKLEWARCPVSPVWQRVKYLIAESLILKPLT